MSISVIEHNLIFKRPSGTSRGILNDKLSCFITSGQGDLLTGAGEVSLIQNLSLEDSANIMELVQRVLDKDDWRAFCSDNQLPAVLFGIEMFERSKSSKNPFELFPSSFVDGRQGISINGLIWMGDKAFMFDQIKQKLSEGFSCLKLKIGAINFNDELALLKYVRDHFPQKDVELRVDANGAFSADDALEKMKRLSEYDLHSIEQPIKQNQIDQMARLCSLSPLAIALDEELIGINSRAEKSDIIRLIQPQYIILKPSLIGGIQESEEWIELAEESDVGWWITSALESNIGLNAIAQWTYTKGSNMYQGLGTGGLFSNNIDAPLYVEDGSLKYDPDAEWNTQLLMFPNEG